MKFLHIGPCLGLALLLAACIDHPTDTENDGAIAGWATLVAVPSNSTNVTPIDDASGITVEILGTSHRTVTGSDGSWKFDEVAPGHYQIEYRKDGYAPARTRVDYIGSGTLWVPSMSLFPVADFSVTSFEAAYSDDETIDVSLSIAGGPGADETVSVMLVYSLEGETGEIRRLDRMIRGVSVIPSRGVTTEKINVGRFGDLTTSGRRVTITALPSTIRATSYADFRINTSIYTSWSLEGSISRTILVP